MYQLVYYCCANEGQKVVKREYQGETFRLRKNALHYLLDIVQSDYRNKGYATEPRVGAILCYKSVKENNGDRKVIEVIVKVEKA